MNVAIHPSSVVDDGAQLGVDVEIGPFCHVGPKVKLGDGVRLVSHVSLAGDTAIGARTRIFPFAAIGHQPQDLKYRGEPVRLLVGEDCLIREHVTMNPGTEGGGSETVVGPRCVFLTNAHVAHDCRIGEGVILSNNVMLAGHVQVGDFAIIERRRGGASVRPDRRARLRRRPRRRRARPHPVRHGARQSRLARRPQLRRPQAARLLARGDPRAAARLQDAVLRQGHAEGARRGRRRGLPRSRRRCSRSSPSCAQGGDRAICTPREGKDEEA